MTVDGLIPGYTPPGGWSVQNHIHLGAYESTDSIPPSFGTSHNEPPYKFGHIETRTPIYVAQIELTRSWTGIPFDHVLKNSGNTSPITFEDKRYHFRVDLFGLDLLKNLFGRRCYLVDNIHCPDNVDHAPYVKIMWLDEFSYSENLDPMLNFNEVDCHFSDLSTVAPV